MNIRLFYFYILTLFTLCSNAQAKLIDRTAAVANTSVITLSDLQAFSKSLQPRRDLDPFFSFFRAIPEKDSEILEYLIQEALISQKFATSDDEVDAEISSIQQQNRIDREKLKSILQSQGLNFDEYQKMMRVALAKKKLLNRELRPLSIVSDEEVKNYYYTSPEYAEKTKTQRLMLTYNLVQITVPQTEMATEIYRRIQAGEDFDALAAEFSARGVEKENLGSFSETNLAPQIRNALSGIRVGGATKPIPTGSGYQILKIAELGAPKDESFEKSKEEIRNTLFRKTMLTQLKLWTEKERSISYIYVAE